MALNENNKKYLIILLAVVAASGVCYLIAQWATSEINRNTTALKEEYESKQKETEARLAAQSEEQAKAIREEIQRMREEQQAALQQQAAAMQAAAQAAQAAQVTKKPKPSLAARTPSGKRAVTVMIDSLSAVGGLLNAGDTVDVIAHLDIPQEGSAKDKEKNNKTVTAMIFQSLQVLAVNTNLDEPGMYDDQQAAATLKVTFAVDPQEAGLLAFADRNGKLELALRATEETEKQMVKASTWKTLADYVLEKQGANITVPDDVDPNAKKDESQDDKPAIQIFRGGKEL